MKRAVAHAVLFTLCISGFGRKSIGADVNSSWTPVGQAKVQKKLRTTTPFRPELSLQENNELLNQHRRKSIIVAATVPVSELRTVKLVNKQVQWQTEQSSFAGRVTAVTLSSDQSQATVFAEISDDQNSNADLKNLTLGLLSVEG